MKWWTKLTGRGAGVPQSDEAAFTYSHERQQPAQDASGLPSFRHAAGPISRRRTGMDARDARARIRDALTPSQPVSDPSRFAGRRELLEALIVAIEEQRLHFVLYGDRGIGKTSLLRILSGIAGEADYIVAYFSCGERTNFADFARRVTQRIPLLYHRGYQPGSEEIERGLNVSDLLPEGDVDVSQVGEILSNLDNTRVLFLLDEFDRAEAKEFRQAIAEFIKNLSDNGAPVQLVIAGIATDLSELIAQIPSIRRNLLGMVVPNMTDAEVAEMLDRTEEHTGLSFAPEARDLITLASIGLPYLVGLIAQHGAIVATSRDDLSVTKPDIREAIRKAKAELSGRIGTRTLHAIATATQRNELIELGKLAHGALRNGGLFPAEMISPDLKMAADEHGVIAGLIQPVQDDPLQRWQFIDDGASNYLWLSAITSE